MDQKIVIQFAKFGLTGAALTALVSLLYLAGINYIGLYPAASLTIATIIATCVGYFAHSEVTFKGHGSRDRTFIRFLRFISTNTVTYLLNLFFVLIIVDVLHYPDWVPVILFFFASPLVSFFLNRKWVFK